MARVRQHAIAAGVPNDEVPHKLFRRHLAVLGNTGAGKSCTVAGLIRWSLEAAQQARISGMPNARFIVLDPNGEYSRAFTDLNPRIFQVEAKDDAAQLKVPAWLWNGDEWAAFTGAAPGVQRPILFDAIRRFRSGAGEPDVPATKIRGRVRRYRTELSGRIQGGEHHQKGRREGVAQLLENVASDFDDLGRQAPDPVRSRLEAVAARAQEVEESGRGRQKAEDGFWHNDFAEAALGEVQ